MRIYYFVDEEHLNEYDKVEETNDNPIGLVPNKKATPIAVRDYYRFLVEITNHKNGTLDEKIEGLVYNKELLAKTMIDAFKNSKCYQEKSEDDRTKIINFIKKDPLVESPLIFI